MGPYGCIGSIGSAASAAGPGGSASHLACPRHLTSLVDFNYSIVSSQCQLYARHGGRHAFTGNRTDSRSVMWRARPGDTDRRPTGRGSQFAVRSSQFVDRSSWIADRGSRRDRRGLHLKILRETVPSASPPKAASTAPDSAWPRQRPAARERSLDPPHRPCPTCVITPVLRSHEQGTSARPHRRTRRSTSPSGTRPLSGSRHGSRPAMITYAASGRSSMDRASDYGSEGWGFEYLRPHSRSKALRDHPGGPFSYPYSSDLQQRRLPSATDRVPWACSA